MAENQKKKMTLWEVLEKKCREAFPTLRTFLEKRLGVKTHLYGPMGSRNDDDFYFYGYLGITKEKICEAIRDFHTQILGEKICLAEVSVDLTELCVKECGLVVVGPLYAMWQEEFIPANYAIFGNVA